MAIRAEWKSENIKVAQERQRRTSFWVDLDEWKRPGRKTKSSHRAVCFHIFSPPCEHTQAAPSPLCLNSAGNFSSAVIINSNVPFRSDARDAINNSSKESDQYSDGCFLWHTHIPSAWRLVYAMSVCLFFNWKEGSDWVISEGRQTVVVLHVEVSDCNEELVRPIRHAAGDRYAVLWSLILIFLFFFPIALIGSDW